MVLHLLIMLSKGFGAGRRAGRRLGGGPQGVRLATREAEQWGSGIDLRPSLCPQGPAPMTFSATSATCLVHGLTAGSPRGMLSPANPLLVCPQKPAQPSCLAIPFPLSQNVSLPVVLYMECPPYSDGFMPRIGLSLRSSHTLVSCTLCGAVGRGAPCGELSRSAPHTADEHL